MRVRRWRTGFLVAGVIILIVMTTGVVMLSNTRIVRGFQWPFMLLWILTGMMGAAAAIRRAFMLPEAPLYGNAGEGLRSCPRCGKTVGETDRFCRYCGRRLPT